MRFSAAIAASAAVVWLAGAALTQAALRYDFSEAKVIESLGLRDTRLDAVFLGSSVVEEGVDAQAIDQALNIHSYNLAFGGASILSSELQLRDFLSKNPPPRAVILGLYIDQPEQAAGVLPTLYFGVSPQLREFYQQQEKLDLGFKVFSRLPAFRYRAVIDLLIKAAVSKEEQRPVFVQGQARVGFSRQPVLIGSQQHDSALNLAGLQHFLRFCSQQGLRVLLFETPAHPGYAALTRDRAQVVERIRALDVPFFSYGELPLQPSDWVNLNHLNERGAKILSARLAESIRPLLH